MSNNILDQVEDYIGPRTCPKCGHQFPFWKFVSRYVMSYGLSKWRCQSCGTLMKCDFIKLNFLWLLGLLPFGFLIGGLISYFGLGVHNLLFLIPFFAFVLLTFFYVKFEKVE
ncbi:MAG: hypothetical protein AAGG68_09505 [Bacteroidota bacterium]